MRIGAVALVIAAGLVTDVGRAAACAIGSPCTKYKRNDVVLHEKAVGYRRAVRGAMPRWSYARIARFLTSAAWDPITARQAAVEAYRACKRTRRRAVCAEPAASPPPRADLGDRGSTTYVRPPRIVFATADRAGAAAKGGARVVIVRRIEKRGAAVLVEVDHQTFRLAACATALGYTCLDTTPLTLAPIEPAAPADGFAAPPP
jgi:hypothetical protein